MTACRGRERHGRKSLGLDPVGFGCAGTPDEPWRQGIAAVGSVCRLDAVEEVRSGSGGLGWLGAIGCDVAGHMDPFHVDRAVSACFGREREEERLQAMGLIYGGVRRASSSAWPGRARRRRTSRRGPSGTCARMQTASASPAPRSARWRARASTPTSRGWRASPAHGPCRERRTWRACARGRHPGAPCRISHATSAGGRRGSRGGGGRRSPHIQEALRQAMRWHSKARAMNILSGAPSGCSAPRPGSGRKAGSGSRRLACPQKTDAVHRCCLCLPHLMRATMAESDASTFNQARTRKVSPCKQSLSHVPCL